MNNTQRLDPFILPLKGCTLIEASAGTGKTYTIAMLYVRLVLGHGQHEDSRLADNLLPRDILVATFTEAATKELSDRIRLRLAQAADVFTRHFSDDKDNEYADLVKFRDQEYPDPTTWSACQKKLLLALEYMDESAITTLHSWCYRMLSEHAFNSGSLFNVEMLSDEKELLLEAVRDYWRIHVYAMSEGTVALFTSFFANPERLMQVLENDYKNSPYLGHDPDALSLIGDAFFDEINRLKSLDWQNMQSDLLHFMDAIKNKETNYTLHGGSANSMRKAIQALQEWAESEALFPHKLNDTAGYKSLTPQEFSAKVKGPDEGRPKFALLDAVNEIFALHQRLKDWKFSIVLHASHWLNERMKSRKQAKALLGFDDLISGLNDALENDTQGALKAAIRQQFPVVLIDEFQDTDDIQYQIIDKVYEISKNAQDTCVLFIGDPKQAIYSFRGGDIFTYLRASEAVGDNRFTLGTNYRSSQAMVDAVNHLFATSEQSRKDGAFLFKQGEHNALGFEKVAANGLKETFVVNNECQKALCFTLSEEKLDKETIAHCTASHVVSLLNAAAEEKAGFLKDVPLSKEQKTKLNLSQNSTTTQTEFRSLQASDIAIIVNSKDEAKELQSAFAQRNLRTYFSSDKRSVLETSEAQEILIWLKAVAEPKYLAGLRAAIATPLLGQSHYTIQQSLIDETYLDELITQFDRFNQSWCTRGVLPMLREFLSYFKVQSKLLDDDVVGERILTNILHISEVLQEASLQIEGTHNLVRYYEQLLTRQDGDQDILQPRLESESGLIQIVTIHKSKGLQYPIVFLPFASKPFRKPKSGDLYRYHDAKKSLKMTFTPDETAVNATHQEALAEEIRKLYVALTRAKHCTFVGMTNSASYHLSALAYTLEIPSKAALAIHFEKLASKSSDISVDSFFDKNDVCYVGKTVPALGPVRQVQASEKLYWGISSYSSIAYEKEEVSRKPAGNQNDPSFDEQNYIEKAFKEFSEKDDDALFTIEADPILETEFQTYQDTRELPNIYNFHKGALPGTFLHNILEWCCVQGFEDVLQDEERLYKHISEQSELLAWSEYNDVLFSWIKRLLCNPLTLSGHNFSAFSLRSLHTVQAEMEFLFTTDQTKIEKIDQLVTEYCLPGSKRPQAISKMLNGALKGFIDLVFEHKGQYFVLDYKGNHLGDSAQSYTQDAMQASILSHRYDLQYVIYTLALHRLLKSRLTNYDYNTHVGGAIYYFLRGVEADTNGIFYSKVPFELIQMVDDLFAGHSSTKLDDAKTPSSDTTSQS